MKKTVFSFLFVVSNGVMAHQGSPLDGTHTDTLALVLIMVGVLLATIASALIVKGYSQQTSKLTDRDTNIVSIAKKRMT